MTRCPSCGYRMRSPRHAGGRHHAQSRPIRRNGHRKVKTGRHSAHGKGSA